jgi:hypothetical protein
MHHSQADLDAGEYDITMMEQAFLGNYYGKRSYNRLPMKYNFNQAILLNPPLFEKLKDDISVWHFTLYKPFKGDRNVESLYQDSLDEWWAVHDKMEKDVKESWQLCEK